MRVALYARVSTTHQAQTQTIEQQIERLQQHVEQQGGSVASHHRYRDDGYSGATLARPGLDHLRDQARLAALDRVVITAPDRLARNYVHQVLLIEELEQHGCQVEFLERPMSRDPHDQLLLQIRGAVAEYERTLITDRMRRGRLQKLRAGQLLPWVNLPYGYRADPERPRDPAGLRVEPYEAAVIQLIFAWYLEPEGTLYQVAKRLTEAGIPTPSGKACWSHCTVSDLLKNAAYAGTAYSNRTQTVPARKRLRALRPEPPGESHILRPRAEWIAVATPVIIPSELFEQVQQKRASNQQGARRNTRYDYLLRALVSCGRCELSATARTVPSGYHYYLCRGRTDAVRRAQGEACQARYIPAVALDALVWEDLCAVLTAPAAITAALERARGGQWLPQELQARQKHVQQARAEIARQQERLLEAYLARVLELNEFERKRQELTQRQESLAAQQRQLEATCEQQGELSRLAAGMEGFCAQVRAGLVEATFEQRRALVEWLIDRVIVTDGAVEIRYVIPTVPDAPPVRFCHLRIGYLGVPQIRVGARLAGAVLAAWPTCFNRGGYVGRR